MQRLDHGMIYLLIAGTYAPICLVALPGRWGIPLFAVICGIGLLGMVIKLAAIQRLQWLAYALYPVMGWAAVVATPALRSSLTPLQIALVLGGGLAYTIGFPVLLIKRPDPWPRVFGYHEVWHGLTVLAAVLHFGAVALVVS
jgi:hemolysin III